MNDELFQELLGSIREGGRILRGEEAPRRNVEMPDPDVASIREGHGLSQERFAALLAGEVLSIVVDWDDQAATSALSMAG